MSEISFYEFPGRTLSFELPVQSSPALQQEAATSAIEGLRLFCEDFVTPLSADLTLSYCNAEYLSAVSEPAPEPRFFFLRSEAAPSDAKLEPGWVNARESSVPAITPAVILEWILNAMDQNPSTINTANNTLVICWTELLIRATRVRLPRSSDIAAREFLEISDVPNMVTYPVERIAGESFVSGPLKQKLLEPPIDLSINNQDGVLELEVRIHWSLWTDPKQEGWADILNAVQRLQQSGWSCTYSELDLPGM